MHVILCGRQRAWTGTVWCTSCEKPRPLYIAININEKHSAMALNNYCSFICISNVGDELQCVTSCALYFKLTRFVMF